jgi:capsular polysaccharide biosynthesis protein
MFDKPTVVLAVAVVLVAVGVTSAGYLQAPTYEATAQVLVDWQQEGQWTNSGGSGEQIRTLEYRELPAQEIMHAIGTGPVAQEAIQRLGLQMGTAELLDNLTVEQIECTRFIRLTYEDTNAYKAKRIVNTVGQVSSEFAERSGTLTAKVWEKAAAPESPVSPHPLRNGLLTLIVGLMLCVGTVVVRPGVCARGGGTLGERPTSQGVGQARVLGRDRSIVERVKEKKLLLALGRRGKLTAVEASLETSLSVEEANRILEELAFAGHLEVTVEDGKLLYSFWGHDPP